MCTCRPSEEKEKDTVAATAAPTNASAGSSTDNIAAAVPPKHTAASASTPHRHSHSLSSAPPSPAISGGGLFASALVDESIETELSRFEAARIERGHPPLTLLQTLECMLGAELWMAAESPLTPQPSVAINNLDPSASPISMGDPLQLPSGLLASPTSLAASKSTVLRLLLTRARRSLMTRVSLGAMNLLAELLATYRDQLLTPSPFRPIAPGATAPPTLPVLTASEKENLSIQTTILELFRLLAPYTPNPHALHCVFNLFEAPKWSASVVTMLKHLSLASHAALPVVLFEPPTSTHPSLLQVPSVSNSKWSSAHQYTSMTWCRFDFRQPRTKNDASGGSTRPISHRSSASAPSMLHSELTAFSHPPFNLLLLDSDDAKSSVALSYAPSVSSFSLRTGTKSFVSFTPAEPLQPGKWYHVTLTHSKALLGGSTATLYLNGQCVGVQKSSFPGKPGNTSILTARIGLLTLSREPSSLPSPPASSSLSWRVASTAFLDDSTPESTARVMFDLGPRMAGVAAGATLLAARCQVTDAAAGGYVHVNALNEALDDAAIVVERTLQLQQRAAQSASGVPITPITSETRAYNPFPSPSSSFASVSAASSLLSASRNAQLAALLDIPADELDCDTDSPPSSLPFSTPGSASLRFSSQECASLLPTSFLPGERLLWWFSPKNSVDREQHEFHVQTHHAGEHSNTTGSHIHPQRRGSTMGLQGTTIGASNVPHVPSRPAPPGPASILINGGLLGSKEGASDATLLGRAHLVKPTSFGEALRSIGGVERVLGVIARVCKPEGESRVDEQCLALRESLLLLVGCLRRNPKNLQEMERVKGYTLLAHLMQRLGEHAQSVVKGAPSGVPAAASTTISNNSSPEKSPPPRSKRMSTTSTSNAGSPPAPAAVVQASIILSDTSLVELAFALSGLSDKGNSGSISTPSALACLVLNFKIWEAFDLRVQEYLFEGLVNSIAMNGSREENMREMRALHLVPWLLTLVADQKLPPQILVHAVSLLREFLMDPSATSPHSSSQQHHGSNHADEELQLVANFALTACMLHSQHEIHHQQQQQGQLQNVAPTGAPAGSSTDSNPIASTASGVSSAAAGLPNATRGTFNPSVRRFTVISNGNSSASTNNSAANPTAAAVNVQAGLSSIGVATGYLPATSSGQSTDADAFDRELGSYRLGSFLSARVRRTFLELLLDVLSKLHAHASGSSSSSATDLRALDAFFQYVDFGWIFSVLYTVDQAVAHRRKRKAEAKGTETTGAAADNDDADDEEIACDHACALLALKILLTFLSHPHLHKKFMSIHGYTSLAQLLLPYAHMSEVYAIVLSLLLGKGVYDVPTIPNTPVRPNYQPGGMMEEWWTLLLPSSSQRSRGSVSGSSITNVHSPSGASPPVPIVSAEALPVLMTLLEEALNLAAEQARVKCAHAFARTTTAATETTSNATTSGFLPMLGAGQGAGAVGSAVLSAPLSKRGSFVGGGGLSAAIMGAVAAGSAAAAHNRHGSMTLQPLLAAAMANAATTSGAAAIKRSASRDDFAHELSLDADGSPLSVKSPPPFAASSFQLDRSFWHPRPSSTARQRLGPSDVRSPCADPAMLTHVLTFLAHLVQLSEDLKGLVVKEQLLRMIVANVYATAPLQPEGRLTATPEALAVSAGAYSDPSVFIAFLPVPTAIDDDGAAVRGQQIVIPIFSSAAGSGVSLVRQSSNSSGLNKPLAFTRAASRSVIVASSSTHSRPTTPTSAQQMLMDATKPRSANTSRPTTPHSEHTQEGWQHPAASARVSGIAEEEVVEVLDPLPPAMSGGIGAPKFEVFHHPLSLALIHLLRSVAIHALQTAPKGAQMVEEILDYAPALDITASATDPKVNAGPSPNAAALRARFQNIFLCSLLHRLQQSLSPGELLVSSKLTQNLLSLTKLLLPRIHSGVWTHVGTLLLDLLVHVLDSPEGRAVAEIECADGTGSTNTASTTSLTFKRRQSMSNAPMSGGFSGGFSLASFNFSHLTAKPMLESINALVLFLYAHHIGQLGSCYPHHHYPPSTTAAAAPAPLLPLRTATPTASLWVWRQRQQIHPQPMCQARAWVAVEDLARLGALPCPVPVRAPAFRL